MPTKSWTLVQVNYINENVGWQVPDILCNGDYVYHEDALTALHHAEFRCIQYNERFPNRKKIPVLNSQLHYQKRGVVDLGGKARAALGLPASVETYTFPIRNIIILTSPDDGSGTSQRAFGQVIRNGETWSVVTRDNVRGLLREDATWTNYSVQELKRRYGYPSNPFFHSTKRQVDGNTILPNLDKPILSSGSKTGSIYKNLSQPHVDGTAHVPSTISWDNGNIVRFTLLSGAELDAASAEWSRFATVDFGEWENQIANSMRDNETCRSPVLDSSFTPFTISASPRPPLTYGRFAFGSVPEDDDE